MALPTLNDDLAIISKLDDLPNDVGGLTAAELKAKFDEAAGAIQTYINGTLLPYLESISAAGDVGITTISGIAAATNVQEALEALELNIEGVTQGAVADNSITNAKMANNAIDTANIIDDAVTSGKIADGAILTAHFSAGAVDNTAMGANAVKTTNIADGAVTTAKLADSAVTSAKINDGAVTQNKLSTSAIVAANIASNAVETAKIKDKNVTTAKLDDSAVTTVKINDSAVTTVKIADGAVTTVKIDDGAVTDSKLANAKADLDTNSKVKAEQASSSINTITADATLALTDAGKFIKINSSSAVTVTIPLNSSVAFPAGTEIEFCRYGTGTVTFAGASGVTIVSLDSELTISDRYCTAALKKLDTDEWLLTGSLG